MNKRKIISSVVAASVLSIGMSMGICAKTIDTSNSIGRLEFLTIAKQLGLQQEFLLLQSQQLDMQEL